MSSPSYWMPLNLRKSEVAERRDHFLADHHSAFFSLMLTGSHTLQRRAGQRLEDLMVVRAH